MAEKQLTTIEQLRALAERGKQDTLIRINELLDFFQICWDSIVQKDLLQSPRFVWQNKSFVLGSPVYSGRMRHKGR